MSIYLGRRSRAYTKVAPNASETTQNVLETQRFSKAPPLDPVGWLTSPPKIQLKGTR